MNPKTVEARRLKALGWSTRAIAEHLGISQSAASRAADSADYCQTEAGWYAEVTVQLGPYPSRSEAEAAVKELAPTVGQRPESLLEFAQRVLKPCAGAYVTVSGLLDARNGKWPTKRQRKAAAEQLESLGYLIGCVGDQGPAVGNMTMTDESPSVPRVLTPPDEYGDRFLQKGSI